MPPTSDVMHVVAKGDTESGMHAKRITSVDQQKVTQRRQMLAWKTFIQLRSVYVRSVVPLVNTKHMAKTAVITVIIRAKFLICYSLRK